LWYPVAEPIVTSFNLSILFETLPKFLRFIKNIAFFILWGTIVLMLANKEV